MALPDGERFTATAAETLLAAAQRAGWLVRFGCRNGNCGACAARLLDGQVEPTGPQRGAGADEILLCRCQARSDLILDLAVSPLPGNAAQIRRRPVILEAQTRLDPDGWQLRWRLPAGRQPLLRSGQFALWEMDDGTALAARIDVQASRGRALVAYASEPAATTVPQRGWLQWPLGRGDASGHSPGLPEGSAS